MKEPSMPGHVPGPDQVSPPASEKDPLMRTASFELLGTRPEQQDAHQIIEIARGDEKILGIAVADGHGPHGRRAAHEALHAVLYANQDPATAGFETSRINDAFIDQAFQNVHEKIVSGIESPSDDTGSTLTTAFIRGRDYLIGWVGNSSAAVFSNQRRLEVLNLPHEFDVHPGETKRLNQYLGDPKLMIGVKAPGTSQRGVFIDRKRMQVSKSLGHTSMEPIVSHEPEMLSGTFEASDKFLIVATDGFWEFARHSNHADMIDEILAQSRTAQDANALLKQWLASQVFSDNITVVITDLQTPSQQPPAP